jgi:regulator of protease activity HflC (stomatin/prohibitin superfamily)
MAELRSLGFLRHLRAEPSIHVLQYRNGRLVRSGPGLAFWFLPLATGLAEIPIDDRELQVLFHGRTVDFQDVTVQAVVTYRVTDPGRAAQRVDFSIDPKAGRYLKEPLERIALQVTLLAQQFAQVYVARTPLRQALIEGYEAIRDQIGRGLESETGLAEMGIEIVSVRISEIKPTPELEKALEAPTREQIQQQSDEASFARRALAVEKERAIQENELNNQIELARREEALIDQRGTNTRREAEEATAAERITAEAAASRARITAEGEAERVRLTGAAEAERVEKLGIARGRAERDRMAAYQGVPPAVLFGLAAGRLGRNLKEIHRLNISGDGLRSLFADLLDAGTHRLEDASGRPSERGAGDPET